MTAYQLGVLTVDLSILAIGFALLIVGIRMRRSRSQTDAAQPGQLSPATRKKLGTTLIVVGAFVLILAIGSAGR